MDDTQVFARLDTTEWEALTLPERKAVADVLQRIRVARNANRQFMDARTLGERLSDRIARLGGSWTFIIVFLLFMMGWAYLNTDFLADRKAAFDPYPYVFLNLILSMLAALQAPVIMMAQNRQSERDRIEASNDYQVNLKSELEIQRLHQKVDILRETQWEELVRMQQEQIRLLTLMVPARPPATGSTTDGPATD